jgi:hypothetical protein
MVEASIDAAGPKAGRHGAVLNREEGSSKKEERMTGGAR